MAISRQRTYAVAFAESGESYQIEDSNSNVIEHPVRKGFNYVVDFTSDSRIDKVRISDADFSGAGRVEFDYLGSPDSSGTVSIQADGITTTITVEAVTGFISISN